MENLKEYLLAEKLKISSIPSLKSEKVENFEDLILDINEDDISSIYADMEYPDDVLKRTHKNGNELVWWKWWKILAYNGPTPKKFLNRAIGNPLETSYGTLYARLNKMNVITYNTKLRCLEAQPVSKWKL